MRAPRQPRAPRAARQLRQPAGSAFWALYTDPRWQKRRLEIFERDNWACLSCEATDRQLQVHHKRYQFDLKPWEYGDADLETLCEECHREQTDATRALKAELPKLGTGVMSKVAGFAVGQRLESLTYGNDIDPLVKLLDYEMASGLALAALDVLKYPFSPRMIVGLVDRGMVDLRALISLARHGAQTT